MSNTHQLNPLVQAKQHTNVDMNRQGALVNNRYVGTSTASQTVINLSFAVIQTDAIKNAFVLFIDGVGPLRETSDFTFTSIQNGASAQVTLTSAIVAGLDIQAFLLGTTDTNLSTSANLQAQINTINTPKMLKAIRSTSLSLPSALTYVTFDSTTYNTFTGGEWNAGTGTFTASESGYYEIGYSLDVGTASATTGIESYVFLNGVITYYYCYWITSTLPTGSARSVHPVSIERMYLAAGHYIRLAIYSYGATSSMGADTYGRSAFFIKKV